MDFEDILLVGVDPDEIGTVTLELEDGDIECRIIAIYPVGEHQYTALQPITDNDEEDIIIYRYIDHGEDEDPEIEYIDDDEEYDLAADGFDEILDEALFNADPT